MPEPEHVPGHIDIAVMSDTSFTGPDSYSKACFTFRTAVGEDFAALVALVV